MQVLLVVDQSSAVGSSVFAVRRGSRRRRRTDELAKHPQGRLPAHLAKPASHRPFLDPHEVALLMVRSGNLLEERGGALWDASDTGASCRKPTSHSHGCLFLSG